jgi:DNA mismatch repair ATPase MutS
VARTALLSGLANDVDTILYRQEILKDTLKNPAVVRELYAIAVETIERKKRYYFGIFTKYPAGILRGSVDLLQMFMGELRKLKNLADLYAGGFESRGFKALFTTIQTELNNEYLTGVENQLTRLRFRAGVLVSAQLGKGNEGTHYMLRQPNSNRPNWIKRILGKGPRGYTFHIDSRDEAGARALSDLRDRGINLVANALAQSTDHVLSFCEMLKTELAFYVGCLNLRDRLAARAAPLSFPEPHFVGSGRLHFKGLYDVCLALRMGRSVVGNSIDADARNIVVITGANQGGKSTFLRAIGLAQLMMQCGMFVGAESFAGELCAGLFTHYKREEDATMEKGKLDEELSRMSEIADAIAPNAMLLFNESFAATNEREGSEIARQVVRALLEKRVKVLFVTHLYEFAHGLWENKIDEALFLRAERQPDGRRTFKLLPGEPLETSYGVDLYEEIFGERESAPLIETDVLPSRG